MLRYVEEGVVNRYAVEHPVLVPANVSKLTFLWYDLFLPVISFKSSLDRWTFL